MTLAVLLIALPLFARNAWALTAIRLGEDKAASFGVNVRRIRLQTMVGRPLDRLFPTLPVPTNRPVLQVSGLSSPDNSFRDVTFEVRAGEILGIAGLVGAGRTELVRAISGADPISAGSIKLEGEELRLRDPADAIAKGIVMVPEDRKEQGLIVGHRISENIVYANLDKLGGGWITPRVKRSFAEKAVAKFGVKGRAEQHASDLSGGNQQKVVIAKWLMDLGPMQRSIRPDRPVLDRIVTSSINRPAQAFQHKIPVVGVDACDEVVACDVLIRTAAENRFAGGRG